ncbi:MAG: hypothetical protein IIX14_08240 [Clostridia bacterium]|nr:hypothetical protein [Clostridia bacterium]
MKDNVRKNAAKPSGKKSFKRPQGKSRSVLVISITLVLAFFAVFILNTVGVISPSALWVRARAAVSGTSENFPLPVSSSSVLVCEIIEDNIILLTTENILIYSPNGKQLLNQPHVYAKPGISLNHDRAVVFDRGGKGFYLIKGDEIIYEGTADNTILAAEYGEDGNYALGTKGKGAESTLTVYDKKNTVSFCWNCAHENIVSIALSDNGKYAGVAVMGAENGELFTTIQYFGFDYKETLNTQKIVGVAPFELEFTSFNELTLLTDSGVYLINRKSDAYETALSYYSSEFNSCDVSSNGKYIVSLAKYGSENVFEINVFAKSGKIKEVINVDFPVKRVFLSDKYIFVFGENKIMVYKLNGVHVSEIAYKGEATGIHPTDDFIFVSSLDKISRCFSFGDDTIEL